MSAAKARQSKGFTAEEKAAMRERAKESKAEKSRAEGEKDLLAKIAEMKGSDRTMAKRVHEIVKATAPDLVPRTWYGMPAYRNEDDKVICFFQSAGKFKSRYATLGFNDAANLDAGNLADRVRAEEAHPRRGEEGQRAREEGGNRWLSPRCLLAPGKESCSHGERLGPRRPGTPDPSLTAANGGRQG